MSGETQSGLDVAPPKRHSVELPAAQIAAQIVDLASNPNTNAVMFDKLVEWQEREQARQAEAAYNMAMNAAQAEIQPVARTAENTQTKSFYAKLEDVDAAIRPIYLRHGFSLEYNTVAPLTAGHIRVECRCSHNLGHSRLFYREAPADTLGPKGTAVKTVLHGGGSTETYLKRYIACGIFNVVFKGMDDDGNRGGTRYLDDASISRLDALLKETKTQESTFCEAMFGPDIHTLDEIEQKNFDIAVNALLKKKAKLASQGDAP